LKTGKTLPRIPPKVIGSRRWKEALFKRVYNNSMDASILRRVQPINSISCNQSLGRFPSSVPPPSGTPSTLANIGDTTSIN
jgi:hypothetical protein